LRAGLPSVVAAPNRAAVLNDLAARVTAGTIDRAELGAELAAVTALDSQPAFEMRGLVAARVEAEAYRALAADRDPIGKALAKAVADAQQALDKALAGLRAAGVEVHEDDGTTGAYPRPSIRDRAVGAGSAALRASHCSRECRPAVGPTSRRASRNQ
jgi:hypothetical protein